MLCVTTEIGYHTPLPKKIEINTTSDSIEIQAKLSFPVVISHHGGGLNTPEVNTVQQQNSDQGLGIIAPHFKAERIVYNPTLFGVNHLRLAGPLLG